MKLQLGILSFAIIIPLVVHAAVARDPRTQSEYNTLTFPTCTICRDASQCPSSMNCVHYRCMSPNQSVAICKGRLMCAPCHTDFDCRYGLCSGGHCLTDGMKSPAAANLAPRETPDSSHPAAIDINGANVAITASQCAGEDRPPCAYCRDHRQCGQGRCVEHACLVAGMTIVMCGLDNVYMSHADVHAVDSDLQLSSHLLSHAKTAHHAVHQEQDNSEFDLTQREAVDSDDEIDEDDVDDEDDEDDEDEDEDSEMYDDEPHSDLISEEDEDGISQDESDNPIDAFVRVDDDAIAEEGDEYDITEESDVDEYDEYDEYDDDDDDDDDRTDEEGEDDEEDDEEENDTNDKYSVRYDMHSDDNEEELDEMRDHDHYHGEDEDDYLDEYDNDDYGHENMMDEDAAQIPLDNTSTRYQRHVDRIAMSRRQRRAAAGVRVSLDEIVNDDEDDGEGEGPDEDYGDHADPAGDTGEHGVRDHTDVPGAVDDVDAVQFDSQMRQESLQAAEHTRSRRHATAHRWGRRRARMSLHMPGDRRLRVQRARVPVDSDVEQMNNGFASRVDVDDTASAAFTVRGHGADESFVEDDDDGDDSVHVDYEEDEDYDGDDDIDDDDGDIIRMRAGNNDDNGSDIHVHGASADDDGVSAEVEQGKTYGNDYTAGAWDNPEGVNDFAEPPVTGGAVWDEAEGMDTAAPAGEGDAGLASDSDRMRTGTSRTRTTVNVSPKQHERRRLRRQAQRKLRRKLRMAHAGADAIRASQQYDVDYDKISAAAAGLSAQQRQEDRPPQDAVDDDEQVDNDVHAYAYDKLEADDNGEGSDEDGSNFGGDGRAANMRLFRETSRQLGIDDSQLDGYHDVVELDETDDHDGLHVDREMDMDGLDLDGEGGDAAEKVRGYEKEEERDLEDLGLQVDASKREAVKADDFSIHGASCDADGQGDAEGSSTGMMDGGCEAADE